MVSYVGGLLLILLFAYALSWGFAVVGLSAPNSETAQVMSFPLIFPLTFISAAFVPVPPCRAGSRGSPPTSPFSVTVSACRSLMVGAADGDGQVTAFWPSQSAGLWTVALLVLFIPLAIHRTAPGPEAAA